MAEPFLKWAGGKAKIAARIVELALEQPQYRRYYEPFLGGGAVFFRLQAGSAFEGAQLGDSLPALVRTWQEVRDRPKKLAARVNAMPGTEEAYYEVRKRHARMTVDGDTPAAFLYLNKRGFNGLCRYNKKGEFNVPFGGERRDGFKVADEEKLVDCARVLKKLPILCADFESVADEAEKGDLVYFDPPYLPRTKTASFTAYEPDGFGLKEHERLEGFARRLARRGVRVVLSNADVPSARTIYADPVWQIHEITARRSINSNGDKRGHVGELVIVSRSKR